jgi:hypothetical protein
VSIGIRAAASSRASGSPSRRLTVRQQEQLGALLRRLELAAKGMEEGAEIVAAGVRIALRPEQLEEQLAGLGMTGKVSQVGEEEPGLRGLRKGEAPLAAREAQAAKQLDPPGGRHRIRFGLAEREIPTDLSCYA